MGNHRFRANYSQRNCFSMRYVLTTDDVVAIMTLEQLEAQSQNIWFNGINSSSPELKSATCRIISRKHQVDYNLSLMGKHRNDKLSQNKQLAIFNFILFQNLAKI